MGRLIKVYIATTLDNWEAAQTVRDECRRRGYSITYDWPLHGGVYSYGLAALREVAQKAVVGVLAADAVIVLWPGGRGTHVEMGVAIAHKKPIFFMSAVAEHHYASSKTCAFYHLPCVKLSKSLSELCAQLEVYHANDFV